MNKGIIDLRKPVTDTTRTPRDKHITLVTIPGPTGNFLGGIPQSGIVAIKQTIFKYAVLFSTQERTYLLDEAGLVKSIEHSAYVFYPMVPSWDHQALENLFITIGKNFAFASQFREYPLLHFDTCLPVDEVVICDFSRSNIPLLQAIHESSSLYRKFLAQ